MKGITRLLVATGVVGLLVATYGLLHGSGALETLVDSATLHARVVQLGPWGPVAIVALMTLAILISPIPSAPIALAAGASYGHGWGALLCVDRRPTGRHGGIWHRQVGGS